VYLTSQRKIESDLHKRPRVEVNSTILKDVESVDS
jgi:hypothetical protein